MEITCNRCHQTVLAENCFCPACGLPQLVYAGDTPSGANMAERRLTAVRDAGAVDWKTAMRAVLVTALPAGLLSSEISPVSFFGVLWMAGAAAWAVALYMRSQRPAWVTLGAGARIGLVTGLIAGWLTFSISGGGLFVKRVFLHQTSEIDGMYQTFIETFNQKAQESLAGMAAADAARVQPGFAQIQAWLMSPEGHAGIWAIYASSVCFFMVLFAIGGGVLGARLLARSRSPEI
jgi:hypothetical protein